MNKNLISLILIVLAIALTATFTKGRYDNIKISRTQNLELENAIEDFSKLIQLRDKIQNDYNKIPTIDVDTRLERMIPDSVDNVRLIIDVTRIITKNGLFPKAITASSPDLESVKSKNTVPAAVASNPLSVKKSDAATALSPVTLTFGVTTTYDNMISLLKEIESSLRIMNITSLTFSSNETRNGEYDFAVEIQTYWLK